MMIVFWIFMNIILYDTFYGFIKLVSNNLNHAVW